MMSLETVQHCDLLPRTAVVPKGQGDLARTITKEYLARRLNSASSEMFDAIQPEREHYPWRLSSSRHTQSSWSCNPQYEDRDTMVLPMSGSGSSSEPNLSATYRMVSSVYR